jgi:hypothetical protein
MISLSLFFKKRQTHVLRPNNFNPPKKSLKPGSYSIETYCRNIYGQLYFITLNYETWEEACKTRNSMAGNDHLAINYEGKEHHYTVLSTKISRIGANGK